MTFDIYTLAQKCPKAFLALPECYQGDNCLEFEAIDDKLIARPKKDQEEFLGQWEAVFKDDTWINSMFTMGDREYRK